MFPTSAIISCILCTKFSFVWPWKSCWGTNLDFLESWNSWLHLHEQSWEIVRGFEGGNSSISRMKMPPQLLEFQFWSLFLLISSTIFMHLRYRFFLQNDFFLHYLILGIFAVLTLGVSHSIFNFSKDWILHFINFASCRVQIVKKMQVDVPFYK